MAVTETKAQFSMGELEGRQEIGGRWTSLFRAQSKQYQFIWIAAPGVSLCLSFNFASKSAEKQVFKHLVVKLMP